MRPQTLGLPRPLCHWLVAGCSLLCLLPSPPQAWPQVHQSSAPQTPAGTKLTRGHAHNDYSHERPLLEALERQFASVEADIFLEDGHLLVGHTRPELRPDRTLEGMYLQPLADWVARHDGRVHDDPRPLLLLIDIKTDGAATWKVLHPLLLKYRNILSETVDGKFQPRAVTIVISGNRASEQILAAQPRLAGIDGRLSDLGSEQRSDEMPLVSDAWSKHFRWRGTGPMPPEEQQKLRELVAQAHAKNRRVRFWATPESELLWTELRRAGVDLIGTDDLPRLEKFLAQPAPDAPINGSGGK